MARWSESMIFESEEAALACPLVGTNRNRAYRVESGGTIAYVVAISPAEACARAARRLGITIELVTAPKSKVKQLVGRLTGEERQELKALLEAE